MTKKKQLKTLCIALIFAIAIFAIATVCDNKSEEAGESQVPVTELAVSDIEKISYTTYYSSFSFEKSDGEWIYNNNHDFPLDQNYMSDLTSQVSSINAYRELKDFDDLADYGLDEPGYTIAITESNGTVTEICYGDTTDSGYYYLSVNNGDKLYVADSTLIDALIVDESSLLRNDTFPTIDSSNIVSLKIKENDEVVYKCSDADDENLQSYGTELSYILLDTCVTYNATSDDLKTYGLDESSRKTVTVKYTFNDTEQAVTFYMSHIIETDDIEYVYIRLKGSDMIYQQYADDFDKLLD